jgi:protein involved in polysaccharide export with SLBB domain
MRRISLLAGTVLGLSAAVASAQVLDPDRQQNMPAGYPLGGSGMSGTGMTGSSQGNNYRSREPRQYAEPAGDSMIEPAKIVDLDAGVRDRYQYDDRLTSGGLLDTPDSRLKKPAEPGEFEKYIERMLGRQLPRFGADLLLPSGRDFATPATATVPPDYRLNVGDVVVISLTGSTEGSVEREIDNDGKIFLPKVGSIMLAGVRYGDLRDQVAAAIGQQYRGYTVTVAIRRLRGIRVYVTGFANNPGAFTVGGLSTVANAVLSAGGPSAGGSFRSVKVYRNGEEVGDFDLYELIRGGNRINDTVLQNEDVLFIPPAGPQVAVVGSVNGEAIYEARPGESVEQLLTYAGGPNTVGDASRVILYRTSDPDQSGAQQIARETGRTVAVADGDILQILSKGTLAQPVERQSVLVRIEGEVNKPGNYYVPPNTPLSEVVGMAGGLTSRAFAYGTKLQRVSVRAQQRESFDDAIKQLELSLSAAPLTADKSVEASERATQLEGARQVLARLKEAEPDGRVVLAIGPDSNALPGDILLENNDQIIVPPRATTVGVFGAVYRPASFMLNGEPMRVKDYIDQAGGTLRAADSNDIFVVRANGGVLSKRRGALNARVLPGDMIFVPVKTQSGSFWAKVREISTILFHVGISAASVGVLAK